ncbi:metal-dependent transcriptional regulator [Candidatus Micrarchaeota archaeon]|nr:metal-dependent transcriptional regulator [Candidatus Micrarchaeota archaeon]
MEIRTIEDYCRFIDKLDGGEGVRPIDLSKSLSLSKNTVTMTLQKLSSEGYVSMKKYGKVRLTPDGLKIAQNMHFKHRVIETFLVDSLGMPLAKIHEEANRIEHSVSNDFIERLYRFLGKPKKDPHGRDI